MIRIAMDRCGYSGFECRGVPSLHDVFISLTQVYDDTIYSNGTSTGGTAEDIYSKLNNYLNIPVAYMGMVTTTTPVFDMSGVMSPPEVTCNNNLDPFTDDGFLSAYANYGDAVQYKSSEGDGYVPLNSIMPDFTGTITITGGTSTTVEEAPVEPGIIEPIMDSNMSPVGIDVLTGTDVVIDGLVTVLHYMTEWRKTIDDLLMKMAARLGDMEGIRKLMAAENETDDCANFKITKSSGNMIWKGTGFSDIPTFSVSTGSVYVNGELIPVSDGLTFSGYGKVYVNIALPNTTPGTPTASLGTAKTGSISIHIGGVAYTNSTNGDTGAPFNGDQLSSYKVYRLVCNPAVGVGITSEQSGFVYYDGESTETLKYHIIPANVCETDATVEGGTSSGT